MCIGCKNQTFIDLTTLSNAPATCEIRSKRCLMLTSKSSKYCAECIALMESLKHVTVNKIDSSRSETTSSTSKQSIDVQSEEQFTGKTPSLPIFHIPKITYSCKQKVISFANNKGSTAISNIAANNVGHLGFSNHLLDHSYDISTNTPQSVPLVENRFGNLSNRTSTLGENRLFLSSTHEPQRKDFAQVDLTVQQISHSTTEARELVTLQFPNKFRTCAASSIELEGGLIKRPALHEPSDCSLRTYCSQTCDIGIYSPSKPFFVHRKGNESKDISVTSEQIIEQNQTSRPTTSTVSWPQKVYKRKEQRCKSSAVLPSNRKNLGSGKAQNTVNTEISKNQPPTPVFMNQQSRPMLSQHFSPDSVQTLPQNTQPVLFQLFPQNSLSYEPSQVEKDHSTVDDTPSKEEKIDLELALNLLKKQRKKKKVLHNKIRWLTKQLNT